MIIARILSVVAVGLLLVNVPNGPRTTDGADVQSVNLSGEVALVMDQASGSTGGLASGVAPDSAGLAEHLPDASQVVVWLTPVSTVQSVRAAGERNHFRMVQRNKRFAPRLLVVPVGSVVDFPNQDPWFHNVFSLYRGKRFDLGLYQAGAQRSVRFDRPGPSYLFCNIHPEMTGVVLAVDSELFAVTDRNGRYKISGVAPGRYVMHVWYEKAAPDALQALQRTISVEEGGRFPSVTVVDARRNSSEHKNKYGESYEPEGIKTEY